MKEIRNDFASGKTTDAVKTTLLTKKFGGTTALENVTISVCEGELFGLLGVNGAGKTTLIRILCGLTKPTSGEAYICGKNVRTQSEEVKWLVDMSPQETSVAPNLTVRENLVFFASLYEKDKRSVGKIVRETEKRFALSEVAEKRAKTLSGGWQRRLSVAVALVSRPRVLFLDEPTLGLDVLARRELWKLISELKGKITILLTSHYLEEIEALCDRVAVLSRGRLLACGTVEELKEKTGEDSFENAFVRIAEEDNADRKEGI